VRVAETSPLNFASEAIYIVVAGPWRRLRQLTSWPTWPNTVRCVIIT